MKKVILFIVITIILINLFYFIENNIYVKEHDLYGTYVPKSKNCFKCNGMKFEINSTTIHIVCNDSRDYPKIVQYFRKWNNLYYDTDTIMDDFLILPLKINVTYDWYDNNIDLYYWRGDEDFCIAEKLPVE